MSDTRFWGVDGWNLLHSIVVSYPENPTLETMELYEEFFGLMALMLPCIYCRNSFAQYLGELPIRGFLQNRIRLSYWLYSMHNKVNDKLNGQGLEVKYNYNFLQIHKSYLTLVSKFNQYYPLKKGANRPVTPIWGNVDQWGNISPVPGMFFIYCILFNYPTESGFQYQQPRRYHAYQRFAYLLVKVVPFRTFQQALYRTLESYPIENYLNRDDLKKWGYLLETAFYNEAKLTKCPNFTSRNKLIEKYRAGCNGKTDKIPTCHVSSNKQ